MKQSVSEGCKSGPSTKLKSSTRMQGNVVGGWRESLKESVGERGRSWSYQGGSEVRT
jgi:hypothetical protein